MNNSIVSSRTISILSVAFLSFLAFCSDGFGFYQAEKGRWMSRDPSGERGSANLHSFVKNNTQLYVDLFGLGVWEITLEGKPVTEGVEVKAEKGRPQFGVSYTMDESEKKCCDDFKIIRMGDAKTWENPNDDPNSCISVAGRVYCTPDEVGGFFGIGPQIIPWTFKFRLFPHNCG
jgi:hypothetical protein